MIRGLGITDFLAGVPINVVVVFAVLTQLGDPWFLFVVIALFYWLETTSLETNSRQNGALLLAFALGALELTIALKSLFSFPRPPGAAEVTSPLWLPIALNPAFQGIATATSFGFPSGHAIGSTVTYGGFAVLLDVWNRSRRWLAAGGVILLVGLSRLVLGVHYFVDILAGVTVGLLFLWGALRLTDGRPDRAFAVAAVVSLVAVVATAVGGYPTELREAVTGFGGAVGGLVVWRLVGTTERPLSYVSAIVGIVLTGGLWVGARAVEPPLAVSPVVYAIAVGTVIAWPSLVGSVRYPKRETSEGRVGP